MENWSQEINDIFVPPFTGNAGFKVNIDEDATPSEYLSLFLKGADFDNIALETKADIITSYVIVWY